jgi:hypothetical protein
MSTCRDCGAKIKWVKTSSGKNMPVDPEPVDPNDCEPTDIVVDEYGNGCQAQNASWGDFGATQYYICHFATCPKADDFRK